MHVYILNNWEFLMLIDNLNPDNLFELCPHVFKSEGGDIENEIIMLVDQLLKPICWFILYALFYVLKKKIE